MLYHCSGLRSELKRLTVSFLKQAMVQRKIDSYDLSTLKRVHDPISRWKRTKQSLRLKQQASRRSRASRETIERCIKHCRMRRAAAAARRRPIPGVSSDKLSRHNLSHSPSPSPPHGRAVISKSDLPKGSPNSKDALWKSKWVNLVSQFPHKPERQWKSGVTGWLDP